MTDCKDCSIEQGRKDLINTPISITYSKAQFPHLTATSEDWGINAVLWLEVGVNNSCFSSTKHKSPVID